MQRADGGFIVFKGYSGSIWAPVTIDQDIVTVPRLKEGSRLGVAVKINELLKAPLVGFSIDCGDQLGRVLLIRELRTLDKATLRYWTEEGEPRESKRLL